MWKTIVFFAELTKKATIVDTFPIILVLSMGCTSLFLKKIQKRKPLYKDCSNQSYQCFFYATQNTHSRSNASTFKSRI